MNQPVFDKSLVKRILNTSQEVDDEYINYLNKIFQDRVMRQIAKSFSMEKLKQLIELEKAGNSLGVKKLLDENVALDQQEEVMAGETDILVADLIEANGDLQKVEALEKTRSEQAKSKP